MLRVNPSRWNCGPKSSTPISTSLDLVLTNRCLMTTARANSIRGISFTFPETGLYRIVISALTSTSTGAFELQVMPGM